LLCEERVRKWGFFHPRDSAAGTGTGADLRPSGWHRQGDYQDNGARLCTVVHGGRAEDNRHKLQHESFKLDERKDIFMLRRVRQLSRCPGKLMQSPSLKAFKARPDKNPINLVSPQFGLKSARGPFHPELPYDHK